MLTLSKAYIFSKENFMKKNSIFFHFSPWNLSKIGYITCIDKLFENTDGEIPKEKQKTELEVLMKVLKGIAMATAILLVIIAIAIKNLQDAEINQRLVESLIELLQKL